MINFSLIKQQLQPPKASQQKLNSGITNYMSRAYCQTLDQFRI